ncbi:MAG: hypothetical protein HY736_20515 [Verrucomicrobia bacterium]|nr:hypothetical protein [Verrucomicrobiota bacterium]
MTAAQLRKYLAEDAPLTIHVGSGRKFYVPHTDFAMLSTSQKFLVFFDARDIAEIIPLRSIESITLARKKTSAA